MISSLVTSSPADCTRTSTISNAQAPKGTATPFARSSRRARSNSHDPESKTDSRRGARNLVASHCLSYATIRDPGGEPFAFPRTVPAGPPAPAVTLPLHPKPSRRGAMGVRQRLCAPQMALCAVAGAMSTVSPENVVRIHDAWVDGSGWQQIYEISDKDGIGRTGRHTRSRPPKPEPPSTRWGRKYRGNETPH
jgi:hypothetical protein